MSIEETYDWAKKQREEWDGMVSQEHPMVTKLDTELGKGGDHPVQAISFVKTERPSYIGEVGKNDDGDLVFHFWPTPDDQYNVLTDLGEQRTPDGGTKHDYLWVFGDIFAEALAQSFLDVFKLEDKLCWDFVPEQNSWVVRASGFGNNIMRNELATLLFDTLQKRLEK